jgi:F-type H+-transporting ATPase subunit delta
MKDRRLAVRYARALLSVLTDPQQAEAADRFLSAIRDSMQQSADLRRFLMDPAIPASERHDVLRELAQSHDQPREVRNFMSTLVDHNRAAALPTIAEVFHEEREAGLGIVPAEMATATPMSDDLRGRAQSALERMTGRKVTLTCRVDPGLLGGAVTRIGSKIYDGSLRTQLSQLRSRMAQE